MTRVGRPSLILTLAAKDWRLFSAGRRAAALCFLVPVVLASAFGLIFHRPARDIDALRLPLAVVVEDDGPLTRRVADDLLASPRVEAVELSRADAERGVA